MDVEFNAQEFFDAVYVWLATFVPRIIGLFLLVIAIWVVAGWAKRLVGKSLGKTRIDVTLTKFFSNLARYAVLIVGLITCLTVFGIDITTFAAVIGAAGLAIGLALQGTLSNFSAGVMLLFFRPFKVGDVVSVGGITAAVNEISLFTTSFDTMDNRHYIVPNSEIYGSTIENITHYPKRRVEVNVGTDYSADLKQTREVLLQAAQNVEGRLEDPAPDVYLNELGGSSIDWTVRVWVENNMPTYLGVKEALTYGVKNALDEAGIGIPFPQMDVHLDGVIEQQG